MSDTPPPHPDREELLAFLRQHRRQQRDDKLRHGLICPRTHREMELFAEELLTPSDPGAEDPTP
ncbi:hypothetical protein [Crossiella sp. CA198]|uniref:hypothetical protein n=1 Tax=Crossiella sp. CA198 TaxID=3455607 RepID=UPI003F8D1783